MVDHQPLADNRVLDREGRIVKAPVVGVGHGLILRGERRGHHEHIDGHAAVTAIVDLTSAGEDYEGGLFVSDLRVRRFLPLRRGDAVLRRSACDVPSVLGLHYAGRFPAGGARVALAPFGFDMGPYAVESQWSRFVDPSLAVARTALRGMNGIP